MSTELWAALVGGAIGIVGSLVPWYITSRKEERRRIGDQCARLLHLGYETVSYARSLIHAKTDQRNGNLSAVANIGPEPLAELVGIASLNFEDLGPIVQDMMDTTQEIFALPASTMTADQAVELWERLEKLANQFAEQVHMHAIKAGVVKGPLRKLESRLRKPPDRPTK